MIVKGRKSEIGKVTDQVSRKLSKMTSRPHHVARMEGKKGLWKKLAATDIIIPHLWVNNHDKPARGLQFVKRIVCPNRSPEYIAIEKLIQGTWTSNVGLGHDASGLTHKSIQITQIERIENSNLYQNFMTFRQNLCHQISIEGEYKSIKAIDSSDVLTTKFYDSVLNWVHQSSESKRIKHLPIQEINEVLLLHGTKTETLNGIINDGLDNRLSGEGTMFGLGAYLAESSTKADQYAGKIK